MPTDSLLSLDELKKNMFDLDLSITFDRDGARPDEHFLSEYTTTSCSSNVTYTPATCSNTCGGTTGRPCAC